MFLERYTCLPNRICIMWKNGVKNLGIPFFSPLKPFVSGWGVEDGERTELKGGKNSMMFVS